MLATAPRLRVLVLVTIAFAACLPAGAQEGPLELSVGITPGGSYSEIDGFNFQQGFSVGLGYLFTSRWSAEVRSTLDGYARTGSGEELDAYTVDLAARYYFVRERKWSLFSRSGLRYAESDFESSVPGSTTATGLLLGLGTDYAFSPRFSLRMDGSVVPVGLGGNDGLLRNLTLGVGFAVRF